MSRIGQEQFTWVINDTPSMVFCFLGSFRTYRNDKSEVYLCPRTRSVVGMVYIVYCLYSVIIGNSDINKFYGCMKQRKGFLDGGSIPPRSTKNILSITGKTRHKFDSMFLLGLTRFRQGKISEQTTSEATDLISANQSNRK